MKQQNDLLHRSFRSALLLPLVLASCSDEMHVFRLDDGASGLRLELQAVIDQTADTRADESGFADGDRFGLFVVNYSDGQPSALTLSGNQVNNVAMTYNADANRWQSTTDIYWRDPITPADVYGYYPFYNGLSSVDSYTFEVRADQSVAGTDGEMSAYEASDFLWARTQRATPGKKVELTFSHVMAGVKVVLEQGSGFDGDAWTKLDKTVTVDNTIRTSEIDLSTGVVTPLGSFDRNIVMNPDGDAWRAVVVPQTVAAGKSTIGITIDGKAYAYTRTDEMTYTPGKLHTFTIKIDRKVDSGDFLLTLVNEDITPWEADKYSHNFEASSYIVVNVPEAGTLKVRLQEIGCDISTIRNLKVTGQLTDEDFRVMREEMDQLTSIHIGETKMVHIGLYRDWDGNPSEYVDDMIPENALNSKPTLRRIILPVAITRIGSGAFSNLRLTSTVVIPESVKRIAGFGYIGEEATIIMPSSIEYIDEGAFIGLGANMELKLGSSLKYIGHHAFTDARGVTGVFSLPSKLEYIGESAFEGCGHDLVGDIVIPEGIKEIPDYAFRTMGFANGTNLVIPEGVVKIGKSAFGWHFGGMKFNSPVIIPESVKIIESWAFKLCTFSEGKVRIPKGLQYLGRQAFAHSNLSGELEFPTSLDVVIGGGGDNGGAFGGTKLKRLILGDNILQIEDGTFSSSTELEYIKLGKNVTYIGSDAFSDMPSLSTFVCLSPEPPAVEPNTFSGIYFDKVILEVPEASIDLYRSTNGWNKFQNITPHHELAFNIPEIVCLDKGMTRKGVMRSEGEWSVIECPDWVHVTPDHAEYKEDVTIKVDPLTARSESREGQIVFKLKGTDYTTYTNVRQLSYEQAEDMEIVLQMASAGNREIPVFIVGEGFNADDIVSGDYLRRMQETMDHFFCIEPYKSYRDYFTVTTAIACSPDSGVGDLYTLKENCFDSDGVVPDKRRLRSYVERVSRHAGSDMGRALIIMVSNYGSFSGWSDIDWDGCSMAGIGIVDDVYPYDQRGLVQHFAGGEAFAGLGNEAVYHFEHIKGCSCPGCADLGKFNDMKNRGYYANLTMSSRMADAPWREFIFHSDYSQMVDMWEGGHGHIRGVWRSEANSVMNTYIAYFNTISRYTIYKEIMMRADKESSLEDFIANDKIELPQ